MPHDVQIYAVERDLSAILCAVRAARNTHVPINRLPPEVLSRILEHRASEQDLVAATHVCQHWRSALTFDPSLWTCFKFLSSPDLNRTLVYLERSKSALIDISVVAREPQDLGVLDHLAPDIARIRSLSIHADHHARPALLRFCDPAPSLQCLEIHAFEDVLSLPDNFLAQQAPSLRTINLAFTRPAFDHFFPLPNLTEFDLQLPEDGEPFRMGALLQFFSHSPLLRRICINISVEMVQDISLDQITSLDSLVEMNYSCNWSGSILPFLRLPRLEKLSVFSSVGPGQVQRLDDILPHDGLALLAQTTRMSYYSDLLSVTVTFSGNGVKVLFNAFYVTAETAVGGFINWFSNHMAIPLGQVEELKIWGSATVPGFHIDAFALDNLKILRISLWDGEFGEVVLRSFHPVSQTGVPCQSLREIEYTYWGTDGPFPMSLARLVKERKQAGYQLGIFRLLVTRESDRDLAEELREHVSEVQARAWDART